MLRNAVFSTIAACALWTACTAATGETVPGDPQATFKTLNSYISNNPLDFETTFSSRSAVLNTELLNGKTHFVMAQPNLLRMDTTTTKGSFLVLSDGKTLTILDKKKNRYAQTPAPATIGASVNIFTGLLAIQPQILSFLAAVQSVAEGQRKVEASPSDDTIDGRKCNKYVVAGPDGASWHAWLERADVPLPCRLISRASDNPDAAEQTNTFKWAPKATPAADTFEFSPPKDSKLVNFGDLGFSD